MALTPTTRARGSNARMIGAFETAPGTVPLATDPWFVTPFVSHSLGETSGLIESDLLGFGREMQDPTPDVKVNDGDVVVPVDARNFGQWLKLFLGAPTTTGAAGAFVHAFQSGAAQLPSLSLEVGSPEVPAYSVNYGLRGNTLKISQARSGLLNATCSLIGIGETAPVAATVGAANPTSMAVTRFPQATGYVKKDGAALGSVVGADFTFSNQLEKVETIKADGRIEDSDPGMVMMSGTVKLRFKDLVMLNAATAGTPVELDFGWQVGAAQLIFAVPRVFLPKPKRPITGPNGIQAEFQWQASGAAGHAVVVTLMNDVTSYA